MMMLDNVLVELLQLAAVDGGKGSAAFAFQEKVHVLRHIGQKAVAHARVALDAGAGDNALFLKALKIAVHRGGANLCPLVCQRGDDVLAGEKSALMRLNAGKDKLLLLGTVLLCAAVLRHALAFVGLCAAPEARRGAADLKTNLILWAETLLSTEMRKVLISENFR